MAFGGAIEVAPGLSRLARPSRFMLTLKGMMVQVVLDVAWRKHLFLGAILIGYIIAVIVSAPVLVGPNPCARELCKQPSFPQTTLNKQKSTSIGKSAVCYQSMST